MFIFDLKSGYHHVEIAPHHCKLAPYIFTKLLRPLVHFWRCSGLKAVVYLDDGIFAVQGEVASLFVQDWAEMCLCKGGQVPLCQAALKFWH